MTNTKKQLSEINAIDGILWDGWKWDLSTITYFFPVFESQYPTASEGFETLNFTQREFALIAFREIASFTGLNFSPGATAGTLNLAQATKFDTDNDNAADFVVNTAAGGPPSDAFIDAGIAGIFGSTRPAMTIRQSGPTSSRPASFTRSVMRWV